MRRASVMLTLLLAGCSGIFKGNDGAPCTQNEQCDSAFCVAGLCSGRDCACPGGGLTSGCSNVPPFQSKECNAGWLCVPKQSRGVCRVACASSEPVCPRFFTCVKGACEFVESALPDPVVEIVGPAEAAVGAPFTLRANASSGNGELVSYKWDLDDGTVKEGLEITHSYPTLGEYGVTVRVVDVAGKGTTANKRVTACRVEGSSCQMPSYQDSCCGSTGCRYATDGGTPSCR